MRRRVEQLSTAWHAVDEQLLHAAQMKSTDGFADAGNTGVTFTQYMCFHRPLPATLARSSNTVRDLPLVPETDAEFSGSNSTVGTEMAMPSAGDKRLYFTNPHYRHRKDAVVNGQLYKKMKRPDVRRRACAVRIVPSLQAPRSPLQDRLAAAHAMAKEHAEKSDKIFHKEQMREASLRAEAAALARIEAEEEEGENEDGDSGEEIEGGSKGKKKKGGGKKKKGGGKKKKGGGKKKKGKGKKKKK